MIPARRFVILAALLAFPLMLSGLHSGLGDVGLVLNLLLAAIVLLDLLASQSPEQLSLQRDVSDVLSVGVDNPATLQIHNTSLHTLTITLHDDPGPLCVVSRMPQTITIPAGGRRTVHYVIRPGKRGPSELKAIHLRYPTRWGFWIRHHVRPLTRAVRIYPDVRAVVRYELMARRNRLAEIGIRSVRVPGQGREFERLREFRHGDELRHVDWKATARQQTLISREFNVERNQNLVLMIDSGRFMRGETDGISSLDQALNSAIMLSYIALGQGDNVSLMVFSNRVERFIRPVRGKPGIQQILRSTYDVQASNHTSDYGAALEYLSRVQRKRALVILITFVTDELQLRVIGESLRLRSSPWLSICALLQDQGLHHLAEQVPETDRQAFHAAAAAQILNGQYQEVIRLRAQGVQILDTTAAMLTERLVREYLSIKSRNLI